jgi:hypothetical protein
MQTIRGKELFRDVKDGGSVLPTGDSLKQQSQVEISKSSQEPALMSPPPVPGPRVRPVSFASRKNNRLSISFPVQASEIAASASQTPITSSPSTRASSPKLDISSNISFEDAGGFMVALAAQERRVLELKEELSRAELELRKLKHQWAIHEKNKKRAEINHIQRLEPLQSTSASSPIYNNDEESTIKRSLELDRRKALLAGVNRDSRRKVITGGHTRTLSLLSPDRSTYGQYPNILSSTETTSESQTGETSIPRSLTMPDTSQGLTKINSTRARHSYQGVAANSAKQIAEGVKAGLWTFLEDLRQATVGEEALQESASAFDASRIPRGISKRTSKGSLKGGEPVRSPREKSTSSARTTILKSESERAIPAPSSASASQAKVPETPSSVDDDWLNWDSPSSKSASPRWSNSTSLSSDDASQSDKLG